MNNSAALSVAGEIFSDAPLASVQDAVVRVQLQDVSVADARAGVVAEQIVTGVTAQPSEPIASYELHARNLDPRRQYSVWVHVDVDRDGALSSGDLITTRSYPVDIAARTSHIDVRVSRI